jgi:hypothetical protein
LGLIRQPQTFEMPKQGDHPTTCRTQQRA